MLCKPYVCRPYHIQIVMIFKSHKLLVEHLKKKVKSSETISFVPTMGALHNGHISLMKEAISQCDHLVVSIFVNPTQFDNKKDLEKYPRTVNNDVALIKKHINTHKLTVYAPEVKDVYGKQTVAKTYHYDGLENVMEGKNRPGHFDGVGTILEFLFAVVQPDKAFFGEKDFQQLQVIKAMVTDLSMNLTIHGVTTEREFDGLAMSSRNNYLDKKQREIAPRLYKLIANIAEEIKAGRRDFSILLQENRDRLASIGFKPDYIDIRSASSLLQPSHEDTELVILGAGFLGKTRIIDNIQVQI